MGAVWAALLVAHEKMKTWWGAVWAAVLVAHKKCLPPSESYPIVRMSAFGAMACGMIMATPEGRAAAMLGAFAVCTQLAQMAWQYAGMTDGLAAKSVKLAGVVSVVSCLLFLGSAAGFFFASAIPGPSTIAIVVATISTAAGGVGFMYLFRATGILMDVMVTEARLATREVGKERIRQEELAADRAVQEAERRFLMSRRGGHNRLGHVNRGQPFGTLRREPRGNERTGDRLKAVETLIERRLRPRPHHEALHTHRRR